MGAATLAIGPVQKADRLYSVDAVRGFALLGILLMNIPTFGLPGAAYSNPNVWGGNSPANVWTLILVYIFGEGKMRAIFSMMFGAGCILLVSRGVEKGGGIGVADVYYRRCLWLMLFGILHGYLIWWGDILYPYGLLGLCLFAFRKLSPKALIITATVMITLLSGMMIGDSFDRKEKLQKYWALQALDLESTTLTKEQKEQLTEGEKIIKNIYPSHEKLQEHIDNYRGNYIKNFKERAKATWKFHQFPYYFPFMWDLLAMMFLGMALYKSGVLTGERSYSFYLKMALIGGITGIAINSTVMYLQVRHNFDPVKGMFDYAPYEIGRAPMALCYVALIVMAVKAGRAYWLTSRLAAVGQMAFSNYISHSLICSVIFYGGYGFGLIGKLERWQLYPIVLAIWTLNLIWSPIWLRHFYFGPLEWCWRSLTYWKKQPMRIRPVVPAMLPQDEATSPAALQ